MTTEEALKRYGSQSLEYRRAWRQEYRERNRRIDYVPYRPAERALCEALKNGWAISQTDAINQALIAWAGWMGEDGCPE